MEEGRGGEVDGKRGEKIRGEERKVNVRKGGVRRGGEGRGGVSRGRGEESMRGGGQRRDGDPSWPEII